MSGVGRRGTEMGVRSGRGRWIGVVGAEGRRKQKSGAGKPAPPFPEKDGKDYFAFL